jgi:hypothetical protein
LDSPITIVQSGAAFLGGGLLTNNSGRTLQLLSGANVAASLRNEGTLEIGASPGQASGLAYQQTATGSLHVELQGTGLGQFDRLSFTGVAQLAGSLDLTLLGGFVPALGNVFDILSANSGITGTFANVVQPDTMPIGLYLKPIYNLTLVQLMVVNQVPGDYNLNGVVDAADYVVWRKIDGTQDGYDLWRANFGLTAAAASASSTSNIAAPEANSLLLSSIAIALLGGRAASRRGAHRWG